MDPELKTVSDTLGEKVDKLKETLSDQQKEWMVEIEGKVATLQDVMRRHTVSVPELAADKYQKQFSFGRLLAAESGLISWDEAGFEREVKNAALRIKNGERIEREQMGEHQRALGSDTDAGGGFLVPAELMADIIELLRPRVVTQAMGATMLQGLAGRAPVMLTRQKSGATFEWGATAWKCRAFMSWPPG